MCEIRKRDFASIYQVGALLLRMNEADPELPLHGRPPFAIFRVNYLVLECCAKSELWEVLET